MATCPRCQKPNTHRSARGRQTAGPACRSRCAALRVAAARSAPGGGRAAQRVPPLHRCCPLLTPRPPTPLLLLLASCPACEAGPHLQSPQRPRWPRWPPPQSWGPHAAAWPPAPCPAAAAPPSAPSRWARSPPPAPAGRWRGCVGGAWGPGAARVRSQGRERTSACCALAKVPKRCGA